MVLLPDLYYKNVQSIPLNELVSRNVKGIAIDVDNTLIDYKREMNEDVITWMEEAKKRGFRICILSNSNKKEKVEKVSEVLKLEYIMSARKPMKKGFQKAMQQLELPAEKIAVIGDQVFTDVLGANRMKMISVYVEPINKKEYWYTKWKRPIEALVLNFRKRKT